MTKEIRTTYFLGQNVQTIRDWLQKNGFDRNFPIEYISTEIAICTPEGILMQIRSTDNNKLGMWGGILMEGEEPIQGAIRELKEEAGIEATSQELEFIEKNRHKHVYANGNVAIFDTYRYVLKLDYVPKVQLDTDGETSGGHLVKPILNHQRDFISGLMDKYYQ